MLKEPECWFCRYRFLWFHGEGEKEKGKILKNFKTEKLKK